MTFRASAMLKERVATGTAGAADGLSVSLYLVPR